MSILQFSPVKVGQSGVKPATYKMVTNNTLAEITVSGFLKQGTGGQFLEKNDLIEVIASFGTALVENAQLYVTIDANGVITLNEDLPEGLGQASLKNVTDNTKPLVASVDGATVAGHVAVFSDVTGTIEDGGALPSFGTAATKAATDNAEAKVASVSGSFVVDEVLLAKDTSGTVKGAGLVVTDFQLSSQIKVNRTGNIGGAGAGPINVPVTGLTTNSVVVASVESSSNPVAVAVCDGAASSFNITFTADPGASCIISYIAYISTQ